MNPASVKLQEIYDIGILLSIATLGNNVEENAILMLLVKESGAKQAIHHMQWIFF